MKSLKIPILTWKKLLKTLRARGQGRRESGAFLLGSSKSNKIKMFVPFDDLDPSALDEGNIMFKGSAFIPLWDICVKHKLQVLADIHTHPGSWTDQSGTDKAHPAMVRAGHMALILPRYGFLKELEEVGIHEFLGDGKWKRWPVKSRKVEWTLL